MGVSFSIFFKEGSTLFDTQEIEVLSWWKRHELMDSFAECYKSRGIEIKNLIDYSLTIELIDSVKKYFRECYIDKTRPIVERWGTTKYYYNNDDEHILSLKSQLKQLESLKINKNLYFRSNW